MVIFLSRWVIMALLVTFQSGASMQQRPLMVNKFAEIFDVTPPVIAGLSQVIIFREQSQFTHFAAANIYVDGEFHNALLPGGFSALCMQSGLHNLAVSFQHKKVLSGKIPPIHAANFSSGKTYYLRVSEEVLNTLQTVKRVQAEASLQLLHRQAHMLSRVSTVVPCVYDRESAQAIREYTIDHAVLFGDDKLASSTLTAVGREAIADLALTLRQDLSRINNLFVPDHTLGHSLELRQARLKAIRDQLIYNAIPSSIILLDNQPPGDAQSVTCIGECVEPQQQIVVYAK